MTCLIFLFSSVFLLSCAADNICGPNESTKDGIDCRSDCCPEADGQATACPDPCATSCKCDIMYHRASNGTCIRSIDCPPIPCGENEEFVSCPTCSESCDNASPDGKRCRFVGRIGIVVICDPKCRCKDNYWRNNDNKCVPYDQCPENTISSSSASATASVQSSESSGHASASAYASSSSSSETENDNSCEDKDNSFEIKQPTCKKNEIYDICPAPCPPKRCDVDESIIKCKAPPQPGDPDCNPGCRCIDNYYKNDKNMCVPKNECPQNCKENEVFDICPPQCPPQECGVDPALILCAPNPKIGDPECKPGCRCIDGYYRDNLGNCIPKNKCPPKVTCGPDEEFSSCVNGGCGRWNCSQPGIICIDLIEGACREGCHCKDTYLRADNGTCIPADQCPLICNGQNEVPGCDSCSPQTCETIGEIYNSPLEPTVCQPTCRCKEGFYRNKIGECISKEDCLKCTGPNEYFSCGSACDNECSDLSKNQTNCPIINVTCNKKCYCETGYARDDQNICIPIEKCPLICNGQNEVPGCDSCSPQTCETIGEIYNSPLEPTVCQPTCRCKEGFYRNKIGECISKEDCLKCTGPNEYFSCGSACDNECSDLSKNQTNCPIINVTCNKKCYCETGYARDDQNICIPIEKCPLICNGQNEVPGCDSCSPQTCETIGEIYNSPLEPTVCQPTCRCKEGFYRNKIGECISKEDCLKCTGPNEYFSCGSACDNECSDLSKNQTNCPIINVTCNKKCYCETGYARDNQNICIPIEKCPPKKKPTKPDDCSPESTIELPFSKK